MSLSFLELLHPDGAAANTLVAGNNCPRSLVPDHLPAPDAPADLVILAPTPDECRRAAWLTSTIDGIAGRLTPDGVVYVLAPPLWRARIRKQLSDCGLQVGAALVHLPSFSHSRYLVPPDGPAPDYALRYLLPNPAWKRSVGLLGAHAPGAADLVGLVWPWLGFTARHPGSRPLLQWLAAIDGCAADARRTILSADWRTQRETAVLHRFSDTNAFASVVKVQLRDDATSDTRRADALAELGPAACRAGAQVPAIVARTEVAGHPVVVESAVPGQSLASLLQANPHRLEEMLDRATNWLATWNASTRSDTPDVARHLERLVLEPAARLASTCDSGARLDAWLRDQCARVNAPLALVAAHHDLTTWNVLVDRPNRIGVVDWATAEQDALPLMDAFYLITDAVTMAGGGPQRVETARALEDCLTPAGRYAGLVGRLLVRFTTALALPEELVELALYACFVRHAVHEHALARPGERPRFGKAVEWLHANCDQVRLWLSR